MATRPLRTFTVLPNLPPELQGLQDLAYNLWWCWNHDAISLLRRIDEKTFDQTEHSPVRLLASIGQERLEKLKDDEGFMAQMHRVLEGQQAATSMPRPGFMRRT